jgi:hypothetical protein
VSGPGVIANNRPANAMIMDTVIWQANQIDGARAAVYSIGWPGR